MAGLIWRECESFLNLDQIIGGMIQLSSSSTSHSFRALIDLYQVQKHLFLITIIIIIDTKHTCSRSMMHKVIVQKHENMQGDKKVAVHQQYCFLVCIFCTLFISCTTHFCSPCKKPKYFTKFSRLFRVQSHWSFLF